MASFRDSLRNLLNDIIANYNNLTPEFQNELKIEVNDFIQENPRYGPAAGPERMALDPRMLDEERYPRWNKFF